MGNPCNSSKTPATAPGDTSISGSLLSHVLEHEPLDTPPNGGLVAWLQVLTCFVGYFNTFGMINAFGAFQEAYTSSQVLDTTVTPSQISWIGSVQAFLLLFPTLVTGPIFDHGYARLLVAVGSMVAALGMLMTSFATAYWQALLSQGICMGIGFGCTFVTSITIIPMYFTTRKALAFSIGTSGASFGGIVYTILFSQLESGLGFPTTTRIMALIMLVTAIPGCLVVRPRTRQIQPRPMWDVEVFHSRRFQLLVGALLLGLSGLWVPFFYTASYAIDQAGFKPQSHLPIYTLVIMNLAGIPGRIIPGFLGDRIGSLNTLCIVTTLSAIVLFLWVAVRSSAAYIIWCCFFGAFGSAFLALQGVAVAEVMRVTKDLQWLGTWIGYTYFVGSFGVLVGGPAAGAILKGFDDWIGLQIFAACCMTASAVLMMVARY